MRFLVTGVSGMLGASLARRLVALGHDVRAVLRRPPLKHPLLDELPIEVVQGDVTDRASIESAARGCDGLFHIAGYISYLPRDWERCREVNEQGMANVLEGAAKAGVPRAVVTSSTAAVGIPRDNEPPLTEDGEFYREYYANPYMATKRQGEAIALAFNEMEVVAANPSTIFGAGDVKMNTGALFQRIALGKMKWAPPGGASVVSVSDCVEGHWLAWTSGKPGRRYILSTENLPLRSLLEHIAQALDARPPRRSIPRILYPLAYGGAWVHDVVRGRGSSKFSRFVVDIGFKKRYFDASRAKEELGWAPQQSAIDMVQEAAEFYRRHDLLP